MAVYNDRRNEPHRGSFLTFLCLGYFLRICESNSIWLDKDFQDDGKISELNTPPTKLTTWWDAASNGCEEFGGHLYVARSQEVTQDVTSVLETDRYYWVGAVQNSHWLWASDGSPMYTYLGYSRVPNAWSERLQANSAWRCHQKCAFFDSVAFGLRKNECYCIDNERDLQISTKSTTIRCPGNYKEFCGDDSGISIYKLANIDIKPEADGECVYARKQRRNVIEYFQVNDCNSERYLLCQAPLSEARCRGTVCATRATESWYQGNATCNLITVTSSNRQNMYEVMARYRGSGRFTYWVGLKRKYTWKWIDGRNVETAFDNHREKDVCLAMYLSEVRGSTDVRYEWLPCSDFNQPLCETVKAKPSGSTSTKATTSRVSSTDSGETPAERTALATREPLSSSSALFTTSSLETTLPPEVNNSTIAAVAQSNAGEVAGAVLGSLVIVAVTAGVIFILWRKKKFCFADKLGQSKTSVFFNNGSVNSSEPYYSMPAGVSDADFPTYVNGTEKGVSDPYYSTPAESERSIPTAVVRPNSHRSDNQMYHTLEEPPVSDTNDPSTSDTYEQPKVQNYEVAKAIPENGFGISVNKHEQDFGPSAPIDEPVYNVLENDGFPELEDRSSRVYSVEAVPQERAVYSLAGDAVEDDVYEVPQIEPDMDNEALNVVHDEHTTSAGSAQRHIEDNGYELASHPDKSTPSDKVAGVQVYSLANQSLLSPTDPSSNSGYEYISNNTVPTKLEQGSDKNRKDTSEDYPVYQTVLSADEHSYINVGFENDTEEARGTENSTYELASHFSDA